VEDEAGAAEALCYPSLTGPVQAGDRVWVNTAAVELGLGSGGFHLVAAVVARPPAPGPLPGRIMKLRYTPWQLAVEAVEEAHPERVGEGSLEGLPVVVGALHSQLLPVALAFQAASGGLSLAYVDRKSTRLNSSHVKISYAVFCLKKKKKRESDD